MSTSNVQYYEKITELQEKQFQNEQSRLELERKLNVYMKSDQKLSQLRAVRLQNYWKQICEDEKCSQLRNDQLLRDVDRVESVLSDLSTRTQRLSTMKRQYEDYIEKTYPGWREKVLQNKYLREQQQTKPIESDHPGQFPNPDNFGRTGPKHFPSSLSNRETSQPLASDRTSETQPATPASHPKTPKVRSERDAMTDFSDGPKNQNTSEKIPGSSPRGKSASKTDVGVQKGRKWSKSPRDGSRTVEELGRAVSPGEILQPPVRYQGYGGDSRYSVGQVLLPSPGSTMHTLSSLPTGGFVMADAPDVPTSRGPFRESYDTIDDDNERGGGGGGWMGMVGTSEEFSNDEADHRVGGYYEMNVDSKAQDKESNSKKSEKPDSKDYMPTDGSKVIAPNEMKSNVSVRPQSIVLPPSDGFDNDRPLMSPTSPRSTGKPDSLPSDTLKSRMGFGSTDLTMQGFDNLLLAIEAQLSRGSKVHRELYRETLIDDSIFREIISNANKGASLSYTSADSIGAVVLSELPLLTGNFVDKCLLPDSVIFKPPLNVTSDTLRALLPHQNQALWDRLYSHFRQLIRHQILAAKEIGGTFAPLLINENSPYEQKAKALLTELVETALEVDALLSPGSTSSFSELPAGLGIRSSTVHIGDSSYGQNNGSHSAAFNMPGKNTLTFGATPAYRQMLGSGPDGGGGGGPIVGSGGDPLDSDTDDNDIERHFVASVTSPRSARGAQQLGNFSNI